jgi:hypothetical protein
MRPGVGRAGAELAPALATAAAVAVHVLAALRLGARGPTGDEARLAAGAYAASGGPVGPVPLSFPELLAARQLAAVTALVPAGTGSVWTTAQVGVLALGLLGAVLLWPVLRRLGCGSGPTALGVALVGVTPPAVTAHSSVVGAAVAVPWLLLAALLVGRSRVRRTAAVAAVLVAVLTAPLVGAAVLALAAYALFDGTVSRKPGRAVRTVGGLVVGAAAVASAVTASRSVSQAGVAAPQLPGVVVVSVAVLGFALVVAAWRIRWVRPLLGPVVLLLAVLLVPGPGRVGAAVAVLPFLAVVLAAVTEEIVRVPGLRWPVPVIVTGALAVTTALLLPVPLAAPQPAPALLLGWMDEQLPPDTALHADALDRAELIEAGFPAERLRALGGPVAANEAVLLGGLPDAGPPGSCPAGELRATLPWWGGEPAEVCGAADPVATSDAERAGRIRIGTALAGNRGLQLGPAAADLLARGRVDPRLMIVLSVLAGSHTLAVSDFPAAPFEPADTLRRQVLVGSVDGSPATASGPAFLRAWLEGQHAPFVPTVVKPEDGGLLIGYRAPTPAGLLPG